MNPRTLRLVGLLAVACSVLAACSSAPRPAATVGSVDITPDELATQEALFSFLGSVNHQPCATHEDGESEESACNRLALGNLIQLSVTERYAVEHDIQASEGDVHDALSGLESSIGTEQFASGLEHAGLTRDDLMEIAREFLRFQQVTTAVTEEHLGEDQLMQLYQDQILHYTTVRVDHILVKTRSEAEDVYRQVTAPGADEQTFLDLAKEVSIDPTLSQNGGALGSATASTYPTVFGVAAAALEPGETSKPLHAEDGWHVMRLVAKQVEPFDTAKERILREQSQTVFRDWLTEQLSTLGVDVNPLYGRYDVATLSVVRISSTDPEADTPPPSVPTSAELQPVSPTP